jgi:hypothetical protein
MSFKLSDLIDLDKIPMKIFIFLGIISGILIFSTDSFIESLRMTEFRKDYGKFFGPIFLASISFIALSIVYYLKDKLENRFNKKKRNNLIIEHLESLDLHEQAVIREFLIQEKKTVIMPIDDPTVAGLLDKGILRMVTNIGTGLYIPLTLTKIADRKLKDTSLIGFQNNIDDDTIFMNLLANRPKWATSISYNTFRE